jgi:hypothetical protein
MLVQETREMVQSFSQGIEMKSKKLVAQSIFNNTTQV